MYPVHLVMVRLGFVTPVWLQPLKSQMELPVCATTELVQTTQTYTTLLALPVTPVALPVDTITMFGGAKAAQPTVLLCLLIVLLGSVNVGLGTSQEPALLLPAHLFALLVARIVWVRVRLSACLRSKMPSLAM